MQVDPLKPKLKPLGIKRLKLSCVILRSTFAFKFKLRRYSSGGGGDATAGVGGGSGAGVAAAGSRQGLTLVHIRAQLQQLQDTFRVKLGYTVD